MLSESAAIRIKIEHIRLICGLTTQTASPCVYPLMYAAKIQGTLKIFGSRNEKSVFPGKK